MIDQLRGFLQSLIRSVLSLWKLNAVRSINTCNMVYDSACCEGDIALCLIATYQRDLAETFPG